MMSKKSDIMSGEMLSKMLYRAAKDKIATTSPRVADPIIQQINDLGTNAVPSYRVLLFNDDVHSMNEVVLQIQIATGYSIEKAEAIMFEAHSTGQAIVYSGDLDDCRRVAAILEQIGLKVSVEQ